MGVDERKKEGEGRVFVCALRLTVSPAILLLGLSSLAKLHHGTSAKNLGGFPHLTQHPDQSNQRAIF